VILKIKAAGFQISDQAVQESYSILLPTKKRGSADEYKNRSIIGHDLVFWEVASGSLEQKQVGEFSGVEVHTQSPRQKSDNIYNKLYLQA